MTRVSEALTGIARIGLDTAPVIYFVESNPLYDARVTEVFHRISTGALAGATSTITLLEGLVLPLRKGDTTLANEYRKLLLTSANFEVIPITAAVAEIAADLRARYALRTPDALQIAAAMSAKCDAFLTNDRDHRKVKELPVLILDDLTT